MEAAWLVSPETPRGAYPTYLMLVRLYEQVDEPGGWIIELFQCQHPQRKADRWYDTETDALTALQAVYKLGGVIGTWRRSIPPSDTGGSATGVRSTASPRSRRTKARHP